jgi:radical SAM superfamily enzyme YgiQ (UPF0313 family)
MNALLLYPEFPVTFWSFKHALKFVRKRAALPPLGLLTVAAMLPPTWGKRLVDLNVRKLTAGDLAWADIVLVSAMIAQRDSARALIARCHAAGKTVVAGGPLFTAEYDRFPEVGHFVLNEAECTLPPFLADFAAGRARRVYSSAEFPELDRTPVPLWELADLRAYNSMSVQYSRGCPFDCDFCNVTALLGHRPRTKTAAQIVAELDGLYRLGWRGSGFFVDDNLIGNTRALRESLLPALLEWRRGKRGVTFFTEASINLVDDEDLMRTMVQAGFNTVFIGIETPDDAALADCNKRQNRRRDLLADVRRIQHAGLQVQGGFIVGFDTDTPGIFQRQVEFIQQSGIVTAMVGLLNALPDTRLYRRLKGEGRLLAESSGDNLDGNTNFIPRMNPATLSSGYRGLLRALYSPGPYYQRVRCFLREYRPARRSVTMRWEHLVALVYSAVRLGVFGRERFHYWGLLGWTLFRRPTQLPAAVTYAIYGHHFRRVCESMGA